MAKLLYSLAFHNFQLVIDRENSRNTIGADPGDILVHLVIHNAHQRDALRVPFGAEPVSLDDLLAQADFLSIHAPLTAETRGLLNRERLRRMKPTAFVINTARGAIIDPDALLVALREGWIAGAALDVFEPERLPADH